MENSIKTMGKLEEYKIQMNELKKESPISNSYDSKNNLFYPTCPLLNLPVKSNYKISKKFIEKYNKNINQIIPVHIKKDFVYCPINHRIYYLCENNKYNFDLIIERKIFELYCYFELQKSDELYQEIFNQIKLLEKIESNLSINDNETIKIITNIYCIKQQKPKKPFLHIFNTNIHYKLLNNNNIKIYCVLNENIRDELYFNKDFNKLNEFENYLTTFDGFQLLEKLYDDLYNIFVKKTENENSLIILENTPNNYGNNNHGNNKHGNSTNSVNNHGNNNHGNNNYVNKNYRNNNHNDDNFNIYTDTINKPKNVTLFEFIKVKNKKKKKK